MNQRVEEMSKWFYRGVWGFLTKWFCVPAEPPVLPALSGESIYSFQPANGFLRYLKFQFWVAVLLIDGTIGLLWFVLTIAVPWLGIVISPLAILVMIVPSVLAYLAIHLRFDTTWYVISDRSLRIRRGIWIIHETTITFENVQNVAVNQGPLQRIFGIADVTVQTAGGGGNVHGKEGASMTGAHHGLIEGVSNARQNRDLIMSRLKKSRTAGLGDEESHRSTTTPLIWSDLHLEMLRDIRTAARRLAEQRTAHGEW